jgi:HSP20 family molecular chaperone IbpA
VKLNVNAYKPEELEVKVTKDRLTISGKHEEKKDEFGSVSREFTRHFAIPEVS